jgi:hypothetical protein
MNTRKAILVIAGLAILTMCSSFSTNRHQSSAPAPRQIADGGAPLPPIPRGVASLSAV